MPSVPPAAPPAFTPERVPAPLSACSACSYARLELEPYCPTCGTQRPPPNVLLATSDAEQDAVIARVTSHFVGRDGPAAANLLAFGDAVRDSVAVVNVSVSYAITFLQSDTLLYATYAHLIAASARLPARFENDTQRRAVEALLFGTYGEDMRYAALSLDGKGLVSYGVVTMVLRDRAIAHRASLLEENSYDFIERHQLRPKQPIPLGYRTSWSTRHQLAMAKCGAAVDATTAPSHHPGLVMQAEGARATDQFMEVYVFGAFGNGAVERIVLPTNPPKSVNKNELKTLASTARKRKDKIAVDYV